ncbi:hypothetical protein MKW94_024155 [Papaver nudicaule]|uniref:Polyphenol oxidase C-terminal domain-containing protein n=1 Tax=Papaver nudicaule TaxID=74823 RepID=A0AA41V6N4_PAPNU|nr:hypothetical protein [Papaver nudicaule]
MKKAVGTTEFPILLDKAVQVLVKRPNTKSRSDPVKFDVFINDEDEVGPESTEFAGSFTNVTHKHGRKDKNMIRTKLELGITDILEDLNVEDDEDVLVTIVLRTSSARRKMVVTIDGISIEFAS